jgi:uncharacterized membrane protein YccC
VLDGDAIRYSLRITLAATASLLIARLSRLPESYWASITTLTVLQFTPAASWPFALRVVGGTALGGGAGAILANYFGSSAAVFSSGILLLGLICAAGGLIVDRSGNGLDPVLYRFAGIAMAIVMLVTWHEPVATIALHRFLEVAIGATVGLITAWLWPVEQASRFGKGK